LRESLVFLDVPAMQQLEAYIGGAGSLLDASRTRIALRPLVSRPGAILQPDQHTPTSFLDRKVYALFVYRPGKRFYGIQHAGKT
jgi:hypothetical protein